MLQPLPEPYTIRYSKMSFSLDKKSGIKHYMLIVKVFWHLHAAPRYLLNMVELVFDSPLLMEVGMMKHLKTWCL